MTSKIWPTEHLTDFAKLNLITEGGLVSGSQIFTNAPAASKNQLLASKVVKRDINIKWNSVIRTARDWPHLFVITGVHYNRIHLYTKSSFGIKIFVRYNRVFVLTELHCNHLALLIKICDALSINPEWLTWTPRTTRGRRDLRFRRRSGNAAAFSEFFFRTIDLIQMSSKI